MNLAAARITAIAWTYLDSAAVHEATDKRWLPDDDVGEDLAVFAGRACYQSWSRPNPATADTTGYLGHILAVGHLSVLEHPTVTFYMTGVSRSFTHELVRHRHFSFSQLSQRYVPARNAQLVEPDIIAEDPHLHRVFTEAAEAANTAYVNLLHALERKFERTLPMLCTACGEAARFEQDPTGWFCPNHGIRTRSMVRPVDITAAKKSARQAARAVLPNAAETKIVVTGNYRAWLHFITMRATESADVEIRQHAITCLRELQRVAPAVFDHYTISQLPDGTEIASSPFAGVFVQ